MTLWPRPEIALKFITVQNRSPRCGKATAAGAQTVTMPMGEILPLLADAVNSRRTWLQDFADDQITISSDLYEVILAYQHHIRPAPSRSSGNSYQICEATCNTWLSMSLDALRRSDGSAEPRGCVF